MKKFIFILIILMISFGLCSNVYADSKITALTELTAVAGEDILYIIDDPSGTPTSKKITVTNLFDIINTSAYADELAALITEGSLNDDIVVEADLKAVDSASDEDILTYESSTGDFEWHSVDEVIAKASDPVVHDSDVLDEDDFTSDSATQPPSQQSTGAYIASDPIQITEAITADENPETITPTATWTGGKRFLFVINETSGDGHAVALSETGPPDNGTTATLLNISAANTFTVADSGGNFETPNGDTLTLEPYESITVVYYSDRWMVVNVLSNAHFATLTTTETEFIPISWMDITDGGADPPESLYSTDSNSREVKIATFDGATDEDMSFVWGVPSDLTGTTIKFRWHGIVTNATGPSNEAISFQLSCISVADGEQLDFASYGSAVAATESAVTEAQDDLITSAWSAAVTPTGLAEGEVVHCLLNRDADGNDTYAQDFGLIGIDIKYQRTHDTTF